MKKNALFILSLIALVAVFATIISTVMADEVVTAPTEVTSVVPVVAETSTPSWIQDVAAKYPVIVTILTLMGFLRAVMKPLITAIHKYAESTETPVDNEWIAKVENSRALKFFLYGLDYLASVKVRK